MGSGNSELGGRAMIYIVTDDDSACMSITITKQRGRKDCLVTVAPYAIEEIQS